MNRDGHEGISFFTGKEVEHTPAYGMQTLFVIGKPTVEEIAQNILGCGHIYFGANMSFDHPKTAEGWKYWEDTIHHFLDLGYWCTLDFDSSSAEDLLESGLTEHHQFIPMISVKLPYAEQLGYNACVKIDDKDFAATNPGVWVHRLHDLKNISTFTDWSKYTQDETIG